MVSDFSPEATRNLPLGSIANPRGCFSVGALERYESFPLAESTLNAASVLVVRGARPWFLLDDRGRVRGEAPGLVAEDELEDLVGAGVRDVDEGVARVDEDGVGVAPPRDHLRGLRRNPPVAADRVDADEVPA